LTRPGGAPMSNSMHPVSDANPKYSISRVEISGFIGCARLVPPHNSQLALYLIFSSPYYESGWRWASILPAAIVISLSGFFEILEAIIAVLVNPELGAAYLGLQEDVWDAQKDMGLAMPGAALGWVADTSGSVRPASPGRPANFLALSCQLRIFASGKRISTLSPSSHSFLAAILPPYSPTARSAIARPSP
jgi:hypothetical protein